MKKRLKRLLVVLVLLSPAIVVGVTGGSLHYFALGLFLEALVAVCMPWWGVLLWGLIIMVLMDDSD